MQSSNIHTPALTASVERCPPGAEAMRQRETPIRYDVQFAAASPRGAPLSAPAEPRIFEQERGRINAAGALGEPRSALKMTPTAVHGATIFEASELDQQSKALGARGGDMAPLALIGATGARGGVADRSGVGTGSGLAG